MLIEKLANVAMALMGTVFLFELVMKARDRVRRDRAERRRRAQAKAVVPRPPRPMPYTVTWCGNVVERFEFNTRDGRAWSLPTDTEWN